VVGSVNLNNIVVDIALHDLGDPSESLAGVPFFMSGDPPKNEPGTLTDSQWGI
jgi:hypothetical protein